MEINQTKGIKPRMRGRKLVSGFKKNPLECVCVCLCVCACMSMYVRVYIIYTYAHTLCHWKFFIDIILPTTP